MPDLLQAEKMSRGVMHHPDVLDLKEAYAKVDHNNLLRIA